jgi:hypothetical protein
MMISWIRWWTQLRLLWRLMIPRVDSDEDSDEESDSDREEGKDDGRCMAV